MREAPNTYNPSNVITLRRYPLTATNDYNPLQGSPTFPLSSPELPLFCDRQLARSRPILRADTVTSETLNSCILIQQHSRCGETVGCASSGKVSFASCFSSHHILSRSSLHTRHTRPCRQHHFWHITTAEHSFGLSQYRSSLLRLDLS